MTKQIFLFYFILNLSCATNVVEEHDYTKTPVFFVHGHGMTAGSWDKMISRLIRDGYPRQYLKAIQLIPNTCANIEAAEKQIAPAIEEFLREINAFLKKEHPDIPLKTKVDLVSHSMGALSARWYAAKVRHDRVRIWLSLAGANHGTNVLCAYSGPGADDLCPAFAKDRKDSLIQYLLNGEPHVSDVDETPYGIGKDSPHVNSIPPDKEKNILYISIRTSPDEWIEPEDSSILDGTEGARISIPKHIKAKETSPGNILMTNGVGHDEILADEDTADLVKIILGLYKK